MENLMEEPIDVIDLDYLKMAALPVRADDPMAEAGRKILLADFARLLENEPGARDGQDIQPVHDMRVSTRRMRSAFRLLGDYYKSRPIRPFVEHLKKLARKLGAVRDLDVQIEDLKRYQGLMQADGAAAFQVVIDAMDARRERARRKLIEFLDSSAHEGFAASFAAFLTHPGQGVRPVSADGAAPYQVRHALPALIHEHLGTVRAYDTVIENADAATLHALRIEFKRLRYAVSYFREVLGASGEAFVNDIKTVQDHLGRMQDGVVFQETVREWADNTTLTDEQMVVVDAYLTQLTHEYDELTRGFEAVWSRFNSRTVMRRLSDALLVLR